MAHGFYAFMGGIAFEIPENITESKQFLPSHSHEVWFLGYEGIQILSDLAEYRDIVPNLSRKEIETRSKANGLAKTLVCIQALWFITQCITRRMCDRKTSNFSIVEVIRLIPLYRCSRTAHSY